MPPSLGDLYEENEWKLQNIIILYNTIKFFFFKSKGHSCSIVHKTKLDPDIISLHPFSEFIILVPNEN